jgi:hypothetical protein
MTELTPQEITQDIDTGINVASFGYYDGIKVAKELGLKQSTNIDEGNFMVCCGYVMFVVKPTDYPDIERRII